MRNFAWIILYIICVRCHIQSMDLCIDLKNPSKPVLEVKLSNEALNLITNKKQIPHQEGEKIIALYIVTDGRPSAYNIVGNYTLSGNLLRFTPMSNLQSGMTYEAQLYPGEKHGKKRFTIASNSDANKNSGVTQIFPKSNSIPKNILLFHVIFSDSMQMNEQAYMHAHLIDENQVALTKVWKEKSYWISAKHLVLMVHPGRIKSELNYESNLGPVFQEGKEYTLVIAPKLKDQFNRFLTKEFRKKYIVTNKDIGIPELSGTSFKNPKANTLEPLTFTFSEAMDYVSILSGITIYDQDGLQVKGAIKHTLSDNKWSFVPQKSWQHSNYTVAFGAQIADLASNSLYRAFETKNMKFSDRPLKWKFTPEISSSLP